MSHHNRKPILLTAGNGEAVIAAFLAGARAFDVNFRIEEGDAMVTVWLNDVPATAIIKPRLQDYLQRCAHAGVTIHVRRERMP